MVTTITLTLTLKKFKEGLPMASIFSVEGLKQRASGLFNRTKDWILSGRKLFHFDYYKELAHRFRQEMGVFSSVQLIAVILVFLVFMVLPLFAVIGSAFTVNGVFDILWFRLIFSDARFWPVNGCSTRPPIEIVGSYLYIRGVDCGAIINSIYAGLATTLISTVIGVALAFFMARYDFYGKSILRILILIPILSTPFVSAIAIQKIFGEFGMLNLLFHDILRIMPYRVIFEGLAAVILVQSLHFFSLVYLSTYAAFLAIYPSLEEQGENMGS